MSHSGNPKSNRSFVDLISGYSLRQAGEVEPDVRSRTRTLYCEVIFIAIICFAIGRRKCVVANGRLSKQNRRTQCKKKEQCAQEGVRSSHFLTLSFHGHEPPFSQRRPER